FVGSCVGKNDDLKRASLMVFAAMALLALPTFFSGIGAQAAIRKDPAVSTVLIERHQGAAILALFFMEITGALALVGLWQRHRVSTRKPWSWNLMATLLLSVVTAGLMARVGNTGGDIRHPEIRLAQGVAVTGAEESGFSAIVHVFE